MANPLFYSVFRLLIIPFIENGTSLNPCTYLLFSFLGHFVVANSRRLYILLSVSRRNTTPHKPHHTMKSQYDFCYEASHHATKEMLKGMVSKLYLERSRLVQAWREGGKSENLWSKVDEIDIVIDSQEKILMEM